MISRNIFVAVAVLFSSTVAANAAPIYNSIVAGGTTTSIPNTSGNYYANSFTTDATGTVNEIAVALIRTGSATGGNVGISLWSNSGPGLGSPAGNAPNTQLASTVVAASSLTQNQKSVIYWAPSVTTAANTLYWVEIARSGITTPAVSFYLNATAPGIGGTSGSDAELFRVFTAGSGTSSTAPSEAEICVSGDGSCATLLAAPEPSAFSILGVALTGLGFAFRRRRG